MTRKDWAAAVVAGPRTDALRAALSDWLLEEGHPIQAEQLTRPGRWLVSCHGLKSYGLTKPGLYWDAHTLRGYGGATVYRGFWLAYRPELERCPACQLRFRLTPVRRLWQGWRLYDQVAFDWLGRYWVCTACFGSRWSENSPLERLDQPVHGS